jgi:hypothetical protein
MRRWKQCEMERLIEEKKNIIERKILNSRESRPIRRRERSREEQEILTKIVVEKWRKAVEEGRITRTGERTWRIEFDRGNKEETVTDQ